MQKPFSFSLPDLVTFYATQQRRSVAVLSFAAAFLALRVGTLRQT